MTDRHDKNGKKQLSYAYSILLVNPILMAMIYSEELGLFLTILVSSSISALIHFVMTR